MTRGDIVIPVWFGWLCRLGNGSESVRGLDIVLLINIFTARTQVRDFLLREVRFVMLKYVGTKATLYPVVNPFYNIRIY